MCDFTRNYKGKTVGITGASGYIASAVIDALMKTPARILRISRKDLHQIAGTKTLKADVREYDCWKEIVSKADIIIHLAGNTSIHSAAQDPVNSLTSTVLPVTHLVSAAQAEERSPRVVFASTATVYGLTDSLPVAEDHVTLPITNYDLHKLFAEKQLALASKQGILEGISLRLANVYGPSSNISSADDRGILNKVVKMALYENNLQFYGDGNYLRDYVYVDDVAQAFMSAGVGKNAAGRSFNVASGKGITVREAFQLVADLVGEVTGTRVNVKHSPWPKGADPIEARNFVADISNISSAFDWRPKVSLEVGIDQMIKTFYEEKKK